MKKYKFELAKKALCNNKIIFCVESERIYHIKVGKWNFWAGTGYIKRNNDFRDIPYGIANFIAYVKKERNKLKKKSQIKTCNCT